MDCGTNTLLDVDGILNVPYITEECTTK